MALSLKHNASFNAKMLLTDYAWANTSILSSLESQGSFASSRMNFKSRLHCGATMTTENISPDKLRITNDNDKKGTFHEYFKNFRQALEVFEGPKINLQSSRATTHTPLVSKADSALRWTMYGLYNVVNPRNSVKWVIACGVVLREGRLSKRSLVGTKNERIDSIVGAARCLDDQFRWTFPDSDRWSSIRSRLFAKRISDCSNGTNVGSTTPNERQFRQYYRRGARRQRRRG